MVSSVSSIMSRKSFSMATARTSFATFQLNKPGQPKRRNQHRVYLRILSNLTAATVVLISLVTMIILLSEGMFNRLILTWFHQDNTDYWNAFGTSCVLTSQGFVPGSCSALEVNITETGAAWGGLGIQLAKGWQVPLGTSLYVTTCFIGGTPAIGWAALQFIGGYDTFPSCILTNGSQTIAGMAMVEAVNVDGATGAYLLSMFADAAQPATVVYTNTDSTTGNVIENVPHILVERNGSARPYPSAMVSVLNSHPLGNRYLVQGYCISQFIDLGTDTVAFKGWSTGRDSQKNVVTGWACGHRVAHATELLLLQATAGLLSILGLAPDIYITIKGLQGVMSSKPVLTYDILSGLERRKTLLLFVVLCSAPSLLFVDVARIYFGTTNGLRIWTFSIISLGIFFAFGSFLCLTFLQYIPSLPKLRHRLLPISVSVFLYAAIPAIALSINGSWQILCNLFYAGTPTIVMHLNGKAYPCAAYETSGVEPAASYLLPWIVPALVICLGLGVLVAVSKLYYFQHRWLLDAQWATGSTFLTACGLPRWFTSLPLGRHEAIKIGNRLFCKPSMQALLGFASVTPQVPASKAKSDERTLHLVSIYDLLLATAPACVYTPKIYGDVVKNELKPPSTKRLDRRASYEHSRGSCVC
ncbi:hypothetical protein SPRG_08244 [Saprolegnia parasitica CBS 223.65]|uniref:Uncharacterized protein n=1 Tax=Saprolegnia parasitica (strain CBS 223.65) TaxID=695850 RepID=A0A067CIR1_SAPPC|nr:hypothetical protein SPRG_08244 [Saprolegnia parasitica CBS 223.65]KDO26441.1 hypothetical protein SPRG_08244 [Saprolegnia parasitica CBS 223.65]|eukprot:XP_012202877.1 hypothetical protein SPRG_08244 [Saprolegnia parasitica CBS 223.65]